MGTVKPKQKKEKPSKKKKSTKHSKSSKKEQIKKQKQPKTQEEDTEQKEDASKTAPTPSSSQPKILLADDDSDNEQESISTEEGNIDEDDDAVNDFDEEIVPASAQQETTAPEPAISEPSTAAFISDGRYHNKQRCLILSSRGITSRYRHFLEDMRTLIPHHKKEGKLDASKGEAGGIGKAVNDIAEMRGCNSVLFMECRKRQDAYLWVGSTGSGGGASSASGVKSMTGGPSAKFLVENVHTMDELRLTGNCMRGSRPILTFDNAFDQREELKLLKVLFGDVFGTPRGHPKSKPFVDRVMGFYYADGKIWVRNYQIVEEHSTNAKEAHVQKKLHGQTHSTSLVEIGPRFVLNPIRIFRGSFGGQTLYHNSEYVSPNNVRAAAMKEKGGSYRDRKDAQKMRKERAEGIVVPEDPLASVFD